ncbi:MAG: hydrolase or acyltransferase (alpha/beta hydrolase superfamily)-like protein [Frankiales bacterium]|nr:hydrolase or acyltransferase (alpha/beta hydrolase superfamily)-like protein [Frankiales bacterium]
MKRPSGALGALVGVVALGGAVGLAAERYAVGRTRLRPDPDALEPWFALPADRTRTVTTPDGVRLHVEEVGPEDAEQTVVLVHGYTQEMAVWHYQRRALAADGRLRVVLYDHRSHGRSTRSSAALSTIDQLGADLQQVLEEVVPTGDVVLVGHSMGGMTVMALADRAPELFGTRVTGVALLSTSTGRLAELTLGLPAVAEPVAKRVLPWLTRGLTRRAALLEHGRRLGSDLAFLVARRGAFGTTDVSPSLVEFVEKMAANTPVDVMAEFFDTFAGHDKLQALQVLRGIPVLVLVGSRDRLTPVAHSCAIADALPEAELVVVEGCGHMVNLERPSVVDLHLRTLVSRAAR